MFELRDYTNKETREIATWSYEKPYDVYNFESLEEMEETNSSYLHYDQHIYHSIYMDDKFIGVVNLTEEENEVFFGISMHPDYCGKGLAKDYLPLVMEYANQTFHKPLYLQVRVWNKRAIKAYENVGFEIKERTLLKCPQGIAEFYIMKRSKDC